MVKRVLDSQLNCVSNAKRKCSVQKICDDEKYDLQLWQGWLRPTKLPMSRSAGIVVSAIYYFAEYVNLPKIK